MSAPVELAYGPGGWHLTRRRSPGCSSCRADGSTEIQLAGPAANASSRTSEKRVEHAPKNAGFAIGARNVVRVVPAEAGRALDRPTTTQPDGRAALDDESPCGARRHLDRARAHDARREGDGHHRARRRVPDLLRRRSPNRIHNVQLVAHLIDDHYIAPGRVLVQRHDRGAQRGQGLPRGARDHQRRAEDGARRRRLPGLDDDLQRCLRGGPARSPSARTTRSTSATTRRARRDGQLPGPRPQVRQRHRALALAAHLRRLVVADRRALRDAAEPARRERRLAARRDRVRRP